MSWSLKPVVDHSLIVFWFIPFLIISLARIGLLYYFHRSSPKDSNLKYWHHLFLLGTYLAGFLWAATSLFLFPETSTLNQTMFCLIIVGVAAGAISSLCPSRPVVIGFLSLVLIPLAARMLSLETEGSQFIGFLVLVLWTVMLAGAKRINQTISDNIELRFQGVLREKHLKTSEERYRHIFNDAPLGIIQYDQTGMVTDCNRYLIDLLGTNRQKVMELNLLTMLRDTNLILSINDSLTKGYGYFEGEYTSITGSKTTPIRAFFKALRAQDNSILGGVAVVEDFTEKKRFEEKIYRYASYDFLTGLPNRRLLNEKLIEEISRACRHDYFGALLFLDLDSFKTINDSLGHDIGDDLLKLVASRIRECIRKEDIAARMGGDEFVIILTELGKSIEIAANNAGMIAEDIRLCLSAPCNLAGHELQTGASIGVSLFPKAQKSADDILKQADTAMYKAKAEGRNSIRFFSPDMQKVADGRLMLNYELKTALNNNEFTLYYQPQVDVTGNIVGGEGLLRWNHPTRGLLAPGEFLEAAEETGLMPDIGKWVLQFACEQIKEWDDAGLLRSPQTLSVNISGKEFVESDFVSTLLGICESTGASPSFLGIELTEGSLISTSSEIVNKIATLQELGIKFSIDDFGMGYSSLSYLNKLPINTLKIDRSFVSEISQGRGSVILIDTIIMMAQNLGLEIIAEGVESDIELKYLSSGGCTVYQGYYYSKPVPAASFLKLLSSSLHGPVFKPVS